MTEGMDCPQQTHYEIDAERRIIEKYGHLFKPAPEGFYETELTPALTSQSEEEFEARRRRG